MVALNSVRSALSLVAKNASMGLSRRIAEPTSPSEPVTRSLITTFSQTFKSVVDTKKSCAVDRPANQ